MICIYIDTFTCIRHALSVACFSQLHSFLFVLTLLPVSFGLAFTAIPKLFCLETFSLLKLLFWATDFYFYVVVFDRNGIWNIRNYLNSTIVSGFLFLGDNAHSKMSPLGHKNLYAVCIFAFANCVWTCVFCNELCKRD